MSELGGKGGVGVREGGAFGGGVSGLEDGNVIREDRSEGAA